MKKLILSICILLSVSNLFADEGMWLPVLLKKYNIEDMQEKGFKLTAEDIYDINNAALKDAVVGLVRLENPFHHFCTGQVISSQGLLLTNHHCAFSQIQRHSALGNDYLKDGFWARNKAEELTNEGIGVCFLKRMEDVTEEVNKNIPTDASIEKIDSLRKINIKAIEEKAVAGTHYLAKVKPFFSGNEYYLSVYEIFKDIRLVGAPPSSVGKFGGDTDNWMWPRHTGDFTLFRIYAGKDNKPADISTENVPYKPINFLKISLDGVQKNDFTMVMGYPGTTEEYLPSYAVALKKDKINPIRIKIRNEAISIMKADMEKSSEVRIKYAAKVANKANGWKKWIGENRGLSRLNVIDKKKEKEREFEKWVNQDEKRKKEFGHILHNYKVLYDEISDYEIFYAYFSETVKGNEILSFAGKSHKLLKLSRKDNVKNIIDEVKKSSDKFYKDYNKATSKKLFTTLLSYYYNEVDKKYHPETFELIDKEFNGDEKAFFNAIFDESMFSSEDKMENFLKKYSRCKNRKLKKDPILNIYEESLSVYLDQVKTKRENVETQIDNLHETYLKGLRLMESDKVFYPDANSTFRVAYGQVDDFTPRDGVAYKYYTTLQGIMEKDNPEIYDYDVPQKIRDLYAKKDFGKYANADGSMPVCFIASNHTTGGNSGSPVVNANGELIGINFDRNWEGTMSDMMYDPKMCRNIILDVRYILFIIDKYAGAQNIIDELDLSGN